MSSLPTNQFTYNNFDPNYRASSNQDILALNPGQTETLFEQERKNSLFEPKPPKLSPLIQMMERDENAREANQIIRQQQFEKHNNLPSFYYTDLMKMEADSFSKMIENHSAFLDDELNTDSKIVNDFKAYQAIMLEGNLQIVDKPRSKASLSNEMLVPIEWKKYGTNIRKESQGVAKEGASIILCK